MMTCEQLIITEYIIKEIELKALMGYLHNMHKYRGNEIACRIRSRPHQSNKQDVS